MIPADSYAHESLRNGGWHNTASCWVHTSWLCPCSPCLQAATHFPVCSTSSSGVIYILTPGSLPSFHPQSCLVFHIWTQLTDVNEKSQRYAEKRMSLEACLWHWYPKKCVASTSDWLSKVTWLIISSSGCFCPLCRPQGSAMDERAEEPSRKHPSSKNLGRTGCTEVIYGYRGTWMLVILLNIIFTLIPLTRKV